MHKEIHTLDFIKRKAKKLKKDLGINHTQALEKIAVELGYSNWKHCQRLLNQQPIINISPAKKQFQLSFTDWLKRHKNRNSPLGDLASDMLRDRTWPLHNTVEEYQHYLRSKSTHSDVVRTLNESWKTYKGYLKRKEKQFSEPTKPKEMIIKKAPPRKITFVKNITPLHYTKRTVEKLNLGDKAWISWNGTKAIPVIITEKDERYYTFTLERPLKDAGAEHYLRLDEVRTTPELACINCVTF
jgi:uncharacterized protein YozE (UPF0346 family)